MNVICAHAKLSDRFCALEISLSGYANTARLSSRDLKSAVTQLVASCVGGRGIGGSIGLGGELLSQSPPLTPVLFNDPWRQCGGHTIFISHIYLTDVDRSKTRLNVTQTRLYIPWFLNPIDLASYSNRMEGKEPLYCPSSSPYFLCFQTIHEPTAVGNIGGFLLGGYWGFEVGSDTNR